MAFAFSSFLYPHCHRRSLRFACRSFRRQYGLTMFHTRYMNRLDPAFSPVIFLSLCPYHANEQPITHLFWSKPVSIFGLLNFTRFISSSPKLVLLFSLAPQPPDAGSGWNRLAVLPSLARGFIVPVASDQAVASFACTGRLPLKEQRVSLPLAG